MTKVLICLAKQAVIVLMKNSKAGYGDSSSNSLH